MRHNQKILTFIRTKGFFAATLFIRMKFSFVYFYNKSSWEIFKKVDGFAFLGTSLDMSRAKTLVDLFCL